jgi:hypothetical protein
MEILLQTHHAGMSCHISDLFVDGEWECFILEDVVRERAGVPVSQWKISGATAIPAGTYRINITHSPRFGRLLPLLVGVPGFTGIRFHSGWLHEDTKGCLLPGKMIGADKESVLHSRAAFAKLYARISSALDAGEDVTITIADRAIG